MEKTAFDKVMTFFKVIILLAVLLYLGYSIFTMATSQPEEAWSALGYVILLVVGVYVNGAALVLSLILFIASLIAKGSFVRNSNERALGYEKALKIKKHNVSHFAWLMLLSVLSEVAIYLAGAFIFNYV